MRDVTLSHVEAIPSDAAETCVDAFAMDEESFRAFYDRTAKALWAYLSRLTGDPNVAEDLLQETYYRFLRARTACDGETERRHYLFRIATNLVRDGYRRAQTRPPIASSADADRSSSDTVEAARGPEQRLHLARGMARLKPRERALLWLAYAHGSSHKEIAEVLGVKSSSVKLLLFRARRKLAAMLRGDKAPRSRRVVR